MDIWAQQVCNPYGIEGLCIGYCDVTTSWKSYLSSWDVMMEDGGYHDVYLWLSSYGDG